MVGYDDYDPHHCRSPALRDPPGVRDLARQSGDDLSPTAANGSRTHADYQISSAWAFCIVDVTQPVILQVRNNAIVSVTRVSDGGAVPASQWEGTYYTVDQMFALIADAQAKGADEVRVEYHTDLRYPTTVFIDQSTRLADEERWFEMSDLQPR